MRLAWAFAALLVVTSVTNVGSAADKPSLPLELVWESPAGCPDRAFVEERVERILRGPPTQPVTVIARGKIEGNSGNGSHLTLTIRTADVEETRRIDAASCSALAEAAAVVIALAIDPPKDDEEAPVAPAKPEPPPPPPPSRPRPPRPLPPSTSEYVEPPPPRFAFGAGGLVSTGTLPEPTGGVGLSAIVRYDALRAGVLASILLPVDASFDRTAGATFQMLEVGAFAGYLLRVGRFAFGPTAEIDATWVRVKGFGIKTPRAASTSWPTVGFGARVEARITKKFGLFARGEALLPVQPPSFSLATSENAVRLHEPGLPALRLSLGVEIVFP